ncbi:GntR family transcriptional regulator [Actinomadura gamaensis]|uniref:GntR family transcriptional regulator n=1 Tax=Actinomadura gamaensis TaxID=1763541 RepID=A0ABV9TQH7_9ACTN
MHKSWHPSLESHSSLPKEIGDVPELETEFGVSRNTIRLAISALEHEGLIELRHGHGMFVPKGPLPFMVLLSREEGGESTPDDLDSYRSGVRAAGRRPGIRDFEARIEYPSREVAGWLEIDENSQVVVRGSRPVIVVHRTAYTAAERPVRLTVTTYAADRNRPCYEVGEVPELRTPRGQISVVG